ncbi:MAG: PAS domain S-box protein [Candidatus Cloacimonetes bacterium]|nr:PAS domain S-box protein [Candidatus Cloacimonadota bacterium]
MKKATKILIIEDLPSDAELAQRELKKYLGDCDFHQVEDKQSFLKALNEFDPDLIISDYNLPSFDGLTALKLSLEHKAGVPFIILTGSMNEDTAVECMKAGAWDYVIKEHNKRLGASAISALEKKKMLDERASIQKANLENQLFIRKITETVPLNLYIIDVNTLLPSYANRSLYLSLGYTELESLTNEEYYLQHIIHPEDKHYYSNLKERFEFLKDGEQSEVEYRLKNSEGNWEWFHSWDVVFSRDEHGKVKQILGASENITDFKASQLELKEAHLFYKQILRSTKDGILVTNLEDKLVFANPNISEFLGISVDDALGEDIKKLFALLKLDTEFSNYENAKQGIIITSEDFRFISKSTGNKGWANAQYLPLIDINGNIGGVIGIIHDISKRKKDEEELRNSEYKYKTIFENIQDVYYETQLDGTIVEVSPSISTISQYTREEIIGTNILNVYSNPTERHLLISTLSDGRKVSDFEITLRDKDGSLVHCAISAQILKDAKNSNPHIYGIMRDVSERKRIMNELIEAKDKAEEMSKLKSAFLANMSHELRTPLVGILGFSELLYEMVPDSEIKEMVTTILESGERLHTTLNLILDLSRVEANRQEIRWSEVDFVKNISENCKLFIPMAQKKGIPILFEHSETEICCVTDSHLLDSIMSNVINNAVKYTNSGTVTITLSKRISNEESFVVIDIKDTGIGIPLDRQELIFDAFRQASEGYHRIYEGTGLGLTITKKYIELLNGTITLKSAPNQGSIFTITFPFIPKLKESINGNN